MKRGFTLIEIIVVIMIIGILSTFVIVNVVNSKYRANHSRIVSDMESIAQSAKMYHSVNNIWPLDEFDDYPSCSGGATNLCEYSETGLEEYLALKPVSPCQGRLNYDYENWVDSSGDFVGISLRRVSDAIVVYYLDINNLANYPGIIAGSIQPITSISSITCKE